MVSEGFGLMESGTIGPLNHYIDHTLLKPDATERQLVQLCEEALRWSFASVCVNGANVSLAARELIGSPVKVCSVIGFPLGAMDTKSKLFEASQCISAGALEIDMVMNIGWLKSGFGGRVSEEIGAIAKLCHEGGCLLKVIIETALLDDPEKTAACRLCEDGGADYVKTCTGFSGGQATAQDVSLMKKSVGPRVLVKASGGIRDYSTACSMIRCGASRLGTSASVKIMEGSSSKEGY